MSKPPYSGGSKPNPQPVGGNGPTQERKISGSIHVYGVENTLPPELVEEYISSSQKQDSRENQRFLVEKVTLFFVIVVATLSIIQIRQSIKSSDAIEKQFRLDQRPYVWADIVTIRLIDNGPVEADFLLGNYGKTPALQERSIGDVFWGEDAQKTADSWFQSNRGKEIPIPLHNKYGLGSLAIVPPGVPTGFGDPRGKTVPFQSDRIPDDGSRNKIRSLTNSVISVLHIEYVDSFGNTYFSDECFGNVPIAKKSSNTPDIVSMESCPKHNDIYPNEIRR